MHELQLFLAVDALLTLFKLPLLDTCLRLITFVVSRSHYSFQNVGEVKNHFFDGNFSSLPKKELQQAFLFRSLSDGSVVRVSPALPKTSVVRVV